MFWESGPGGWAAIIIKDMIENAIWNEKKTTNNKMELLAQ